jgi:hypothetical protein
MSKQIKIGLDKVPAPVTKQYTQLIDIEGAKLTDSAGNPIVTEEESTLGSFASAETSLSVFVNNLGKRQAIPILERFSETSEVSNSLLGVPRGEQQLSLFADVATYGLDEDNWNYYTFSNATYPGEWYNKENPIFGRRSNPTFNEGSEEQALYLKSFPSQYSFPGSTIASKLTTPTSNFKSYMNFIAMGKYLYSIFYPINPTFADLNFIDNSIYIVDSAERPVANPPVFLDTSLAFDGNGTYFDVTYGDNLRLAFDKIERWTYFFGLIVNGTDTYPELSGSAILDFKLQSSYSYIRSFCATECTPGGGSGVENFAILESKKTFRYQPGRVSGFTFGVRMQADPATNVNFIEWGCSNDTDEYMFQLRGSQFNIVRRSVIRMPDDLLIRQGLLPSDQSENAIYPKGVGNSTPMWETVIPRTKFNGDSLLGSGPSGYILSFENVTMYKIEYSWYGAIGAKFYAYTPSGNGDARWILMHTFIIENGLGKPVLKNPDFKFKYLIYAADNATVKSPIYLYKYGSSYYVDGGDEGNIQLTTVTADSKQFQNSTPIIGVLPKQQILNQEGTGLPNFKKAYPSLLSVSSDLACRIDIEEVTGSPDGVHYNYSPSLVNGVHPLSRTLNFQYQENSNNIIDILDGGEDGNALLLSDNDAKIIADGVYNVYVNYDYDSTLHKSTDTRRRNTAHTLVADTVLRSVTSAGAILDPIRGSSFTGKLSNYHTITGSTTPITANNFKIHFLNPFAYDPDGGGRHFAEFGVAITPFKPEIDTLNGNVLRFRNKDTNQLVPFDKNSVPFVEWTQVGTQFNFEAKAEEIEWDPGYGYRFGVDARLPQPLGTDSGYISAIRGEVRNVPYPVESIQAGTGEFAGSWRITFSGGAPSASLLDVNNQSSEVGVDGIGLGIFYTTLPVVDGNGKFFVYVSGDPTSGGTRTVTEVQVKTITLHDDWQLTSFEDDGTPRFTYRTFTSSKAVKFNSQPLYVVFALKDHARVNNIVIEEITEESVKTHTPVFIKDANTLTITNSGGSSNVLSPSAFESENRLDSTRFDTSTLNPLRPSTVLYSFFVAPNTPERVDLSNIFGRDRKGLARGLLNNKAVFFTASNLDSTGGSGGSLGNIEMTLTVKEQ